MHLVFGNKKDRVIRHIVFLKIDEVFSPALFKPYDLVKAMDMRLRRIIAMFPEICAEFVKGELQLAGLVEIQMIFRNFFRYFSGHEANILKGRANFRIPVPGM